jgi:hypothetical protein
MELHAPDGASNSVRGDRLESCLGEQGCADRKACDGVDVGGVDVEIVGEPVEERIGHDPLHPDSPNLTPAWVSPHLASECVGDELVPEAETQERSAGVHDVSHKLVGAEHPGSLLGDAAARAGDVERVCVTHGRKRALRAEIVARPVARPGVPGLPLDPTGKAATNFAERGDGVTGDEDERAHLPLPVCHRPRQHRKPR